MPHAQVAEKLQSRGLRLSGGNTLSPLRRRPAATAAFSAGDGAAAPAARRPKVFSAFGGKDLRLTAENSIFLKNVSSKGFW